jgi:hypothetical protein
MFMPDYDSPWDNEDSEIPIATEEDPVGEDES